MSGPSIFYFMLMRILLLLDFFSCLNLTLTGTHMPTFRSIVMLFFHMSYMFDVNDVLSSDDVNDVLSPDVFDYHYPLQLVL